MARPTKSNAKSKRRGANRDNPRGDVFAEMLRTKLAPLSQELLFAAYASSIHKLFVMHDVLDVGTLLAGEVPDEELIKFLNGILDWLDDVEIAIGKVFQETTRAPGQDFAHQPLGHLRGLLRDLRDGSENRWTDLNIRRRGDKSDPRRARAYKDLAAQTYRFLVGLGASRDEAVEAINNCQQEHSRVFNLPLPARFTKDALSKRSRQAGKLDATIAAETLAMLGRGDGGFDGRLPKADLQARDQCVRAATTYLLSAPLRSKALSQRK